MSEAGAVLGWDVGWSLKRRSSGVCVLSWQDGEVTTQIKRCTADPVDQARALGEVAADRRVSVAAFDGPLRPGLALKDDERANYRICEQFLTRDFQKQIGKPGQSSSLNGRILHRAATEVAKRMERRVNPARHKAQIHSAALVEAFPTSFLGVLLDDPPMRQKNKARSDQFYVALCKDGKLGALMAYLLPNYRYRTDFASITNHDDRAALICALTALCVHQRKYAAIGDPEDGYMILPPLKLWSRWALLTLRENIAKGYSGDLLVEEF